MLNRRLVAVAAGVLIAVGAAAWFVGCSSSINPGGGGDNPSVSFTLAGATILLEFGPAGVFILETGKTSTNIADIVPFERPPDDEPIFAVARLAAEDVTLRSTTVEDGGVSSSDGAAPKEDGFTGAIFLNIYVDETGAARPCETGVNIGEYILRFDFGVLHADFVDLEGDFSAKRVPRDALAVLLSNGYSVCLVARPESQGEIRGTLEIRGVRLTFGPSGNAGVSQLVDPDPGEMQACCWPPLTDYFQFNEPRRQLCEDLGYDANFGSPRKYCEGHGGFWKGEGSSCANTHCNEDFRVCCGGRRCNELPEKFCHQSQGVNGNVLGEAFPAGFTCETLPAPCDEEMAACCHSDGPCRTIPIGIVGECPDGGISQGVGTDCRTTTCPAAPPASNKQACCFESGSCDDLSPEDCGLTGGAPKGPGTNCSPNLCPQPAPKAACCASSGTCTLVTQSACTAPGTTFNSSSATCSPNPCPQPAPTGACCVAGVCDPKTAAECQADAGVYSGDGTGCAAVECAPPVEYLVWYTGNVSCWGAPLIYIDSRDSFNQPGYAANYPGGGIDYSVLLVKTELHGGFASVEEARAWICPQFVSRYSHYWCSSYYQTANCNWQPGALGCDLSALPFTDALPAGTSCP